MPHIVIPGWGWDLRVEVYSWQIPIYGQQSMICYGGASLSDGYGGRLPIIKRVVTVEKKNEAPKQENVTTYVIKVDPISMVNLALILGIFLAIYYYFMKM